MSDYPAELGKQLESQSLLSAESNPMADRLIGFELVERYKIIRLIGTGGWGNVYLGQHLSLKTNVAVKVIHKHLCQDEKSLRRLGKEAKLLSRLENQNIVRVMDYGMEPLPFIVMEYFDGIPLSKWLRENGPMPYELAIELFLQMCDGLSNARELGLVHRDLKPANVLLNIEGKQLRSKIVDFGLAKLIDESEFQEKLTSTGEILGSPPYMSPEQWTGRADHRSDLYSFGCIMYEVLSGKLAFSADYGVAYLREHLTTYPPAMKEVYKGAGFPGVLEDIVCKCIQKSPKDRYQTSAALKADLERVKSGRPIKVRLPSARKLFGKKEVLIATFAVFALLSGGFALMRYEPFLTPLCLSLNSSADKDRSLGKTDEALSGYRLTILFAKNLPKQDKHKLHAMRMLSSALKERQQWQEAGLLEKELLVLTCGDGRAEMQKILQNLESVRDNQSNPANAEVYARKALEQASALCGEHSLVYAEVADLLGSIMRSRGMTDSALPYHRQAVKITEDLVEPDSPVIVERLNKLGHAYSELGRFAEAEKLYEQYIVLNTRAGNETNLSTLYCGLGDLNSQSRRYEKSFEYYKKALELCEKCGGSNGISILTSIAQLYKRQNAVDKAVEYFKKALDLQKLEKSDALPTAELQWTNLGEVFFLMKDFTNAENCFEKGLKIREANGSRSPRIAVLLKDLIQVKAKLGKDAEVSELKARLAKISDLPLQQPKSSVTMNDPKK
jgi:serine/threonine protein kinase/lipopolysaccharide biosynthesis regulator YciM